MLQQYFSTDAEREHLKATLKSNLKKGNVLVFRGKKRSGKSTFYQALKQAFKEKYGNDQDVELSIYSETDILPRISRHKIIVHDTINMTKVFVSDPRLHEIRFDKDMMNDNVPIDQKEVIEQLKDHIFNIL